MKITHTTEDGNGNVVEQFDVDVPDPEPTVEERLAVVEQKVTDPAGDGKDLAGKIAELQSVLVAKGVIDQADTIDVGGDVKDLGGGGLVVEPGGDPGKG